MNPTAGLQLPAVRGRRDRIASVNEADKLLAEAQKRAETEQRRMRMKAALARTGKVLKAVGRAAIVAGVAAGIASARAENRARKLSKKAKR